MMKHRSSGILLAVLALAASALSFASGAEEVRESVYESSLDIDSIAGLAYLPTVEAQVVEIEIYAIPDFADRGVVVLVVEVSAPAFNDADPLVSVVSTHAESVTVPGRC